MSSYLSQMEKEGGMTVKSETVPANIKLVSEKKTWRAEELSYFQIRRDKE